VEIDVAPGRLQAEVDPDQVRQLLLNLLRNALAAAGRGGRVRTFFSQVDGQVRIHVLGLGREHRHRGPPAHLRALLHQAPRGDRPGPVHVHSIVRAHGGQIEVSSSPGEGTEFVVGFAAPVHEVRNA
jgi:two-component system sensor histidine kinase PilS (NtrC family)